MHQNLTAGGSCTPIVIVAYRDMRLSEAARLMRRHRVGCLVVVDETDPGRAVIGILTDRDIVTAAISDDLDPRFMAVGDVMTQDPLLVREADPVRDVLEAMRRMGIRRMPVTNLQGMLTGIITLDDVLDVLSEEMEAMARMVGKGRRREHGVAA